MKLRWYIYYDIKYIVFNNMIIKILRIFFDLIEIISATSEIILKSLLVSQNVVFLKYIYISDTILNAFSFSQNYQ